jgi:hypothetical protein
VSSAHGSTVDRPFNKKGYAIRAARARSDGPGRTRAGCGGKHAGVRRRAVGARRRCAWAAFSATNTTEGTHAHVIVGSRGAIVPHRQPAPEGGRAAAPASSRVRQSALGEGELGGD